MNKINRYINLLCFISLDVCHVLTNNDAIERAVNGIVRQLESSGDNEIQSKFIGELVMNALAEIDNVAYIRYASVYRNFREASDFGKFVETEIKD